MIGDTGEERAKPGDRWGRERMQVQTGAGVDGKAAPIVQAEGQQASHRGRTGPIHTSCLLLLVLQTALAVCLCRNPDGEGRNRLVARGPKQRDQESGRDST